MGWFRRRARQKVFVIGRNKTGTTSMREALATLGYKVGKQGVAQRYIEDWAVRDFRRIVRYCETADVFADVPFSIPYTYQALDEAFPKSKFILTVRTSAEVWFESAQRFNNQVIGKGQLPSVDDLKALPYIWPGWMWRNHQLTYGVDESGLYDRDIYMRHYETHNQAVIEYFRYRPNDLLVTNVASANAMRELCEFLSMPYTQQPMPHLNRTA